MESRVETTSVEGSSRDLAEAGRVEGPAAYLETARFVQLEGARRHDDAMAALASALALDPFDVRTLYFRAGIRRLLGDARGARADLVRVLDRRPDMLAAAEDLANLFLEEGDSKRALAVVEALAVADPEGGRGRRARQLRQRAAIRIARRARDCADLASLEASPEAESRKEVAWAAASFETPEAEALLRRLLADPDEGVRRRAAQAFQRPWLVDRAVADPALASALAVRLVADESPVVREAIAVALGRVGSDVATSTLVARLVGSGREPLGAVRAAVIEALAATDRPPLRRALVVSLAHDDVVAREAAIRALARMTGTDRGFRADDPPARRAEALAAWERWAADGAQ
jgi:HEAT repeat protein